MVDLSKELLAENQDLVQPPFTNLHPQGVRGIFQMAEIDEIVDLAARLVA